MTNLRLSSLLHPIVLAGACVCLLISGGITSSRAAGVQDGYTGATFVVPYATHKPIIDGRIGAEWNDALCITGLQTTDKKVSPRQTQFWMMWDEDNIYIAMRSPLRPGERLMQAYRDTTTDVSKVVFDDAYEVWIDAGTLSPDGEPAYFQYLGNYAGARYDVMFEPAVGNSRPGWTSNWNPHSAISQDGKYWEMEMAIPRASIYKNTSFKDGFSFSALLARDYKRPWDQDSISGSGSYQVRDTYAHFVLSKDAPGVHLLGVGDPQSQTFGLQLSAAGTQAQTLHWKFDSDAGVHQDGSLLVTPGAEATLASLLGLDKPGNGAYRIKVTSADGKTSYLDWSAQRQWGDLSALTQKLNDTGDTVALSLQFNPVHNYVRVTGDLINFDQRAQIAKCLVTVNDSTQKQLAGSTLHIDKLAYVSGVVPLSNLAPGTYSTTLTAYDKTGKTVFTRQTNFEKKDPAKDFAWWNTSMGNAAKVLAPWTPVRYSNGKFGVWGRSIQLGAAGLPSQISSQGIDILSSGAQLTADFGGKVVSASNIAVKPVSTANYRTVLATDSNLKTIGVHTVTTVEYDGMYKVTMTLTPRGKVSVNSLKVIVPLRGDLATYLHANGDGIRTGYDIRFLPTQKQGELWNSKQVEGQPMVVGSFIPYVWVGDTKAGLCWFADSDEGWTPNNAVPAITVQRESAQTTNLVLNLIGAPETLSGPRTITFAFEATPVKPMDSGWRMNTWWTGDSFKDWAQVESQGHAGDEGLIFSSIPFPLDPAASKAMVEARHQEMDSIFGVAKYHANAVPYFEHINMGDQFVPELAYFGDEWRTNVTRGLAYGKSLQDFMVYHVGNWAKDCGIDGFYIDNVAPIADNNVESGRGYRLPDGRIQPSYQMFDTRTYLLRMRAALAEQGKSGKFVMHITDHMIAPWVESADVALDGEDHVIYPEMNRDFMDFWTLERMRLDYPEQWGTPVNFLQEYQGSWDPAKLKTAIRAYTGMMLLDDTLASANPNGNNQELWQARDRFGIEADDVKFVPYWLKDGSLKSLTPGVYSSGWTRPVGPGLNKLMLAVVNTGEGQPASVEINTQLLNLGPAAKWTVTDAETQQPVTTWEGTGKLTLALPRHDYRLLLIEPSVK